MYFLIIELITVYQPVSIYQRNWSCTYAYIAIRVFAEVKHRKFALRSRLPQLLLHASTIPPPNLDLVSFCCSGEIKLHQRKFRQPDAIMASTNPSRGTVSTSKRVADDAPQLQQQTKKPKTISVAGLFAKKPRPEHDQIASTDGITHKQLTAEEILTAKAKRHPAYLDVKRMWCVKASRTYLTDLTDRGHCGLRPSRGRVHRRAARRCIRRTHSTY